MKRILLTGMSGTGKSTIISELAVRDYKAVDLDCDMFSKWVELNGASETPGSPVESDRDWMWRADRVHELLSTENADMLFLSGCASNMGQFLPRFDHIILLSAPAAVIVERLKSRTNNPYGKRPDQLARVLDLLQTVEPVLRRAATHEIDSSACLDEVVASVLRLAQ
jgi:shikimate kinase